MYLVIRYAKASSENDRCPFCERFLQSDGFKLLTVACIMKGERLEVVDLNVDPRANKFYKAFPLGSVRLPAIVKDRQVIQRVDAYHPLHLLSVLFGDVSEFGLVDVREAEKAVRKVYQSPTSMDMRVLMLLKNGFTVDEIAKRLGMSKKRIQETIENIKKRREAVSGRAEGG